MVYKFILLKNANFKNEVQTFIFKTCFKKKNIVRKWVLNLIRQ